MGAVKAIHLKERLLILSHLENSQINRTQTFWVVAKIRHFNPIQGFFKYNPLQPKLGEKDNSLANIKRLKRVREYIIPDVKIWIID